MASVSRFAAPRDGDASFWFVYNATPPGLPGAPEHGDSFAVRSRPGVATPHSDPRITSLRLVSQDPPNVATVSQFAAPRAGEASLSSAYDTTPLGLPRAHESGVSFAIRSPQEGTQIGTGPPKGALRGAQNGKKIQDCPQNAQDGPKTSPVRPQEAP